MWLVLILGWIVSYFTKTGNLATLECFVGLLVITAVYVVTIVIVTRLPEFIPYVKVRRGIAIILASIFYYLSFKFILNNLRILIFNEKDLITGFTISITIGILYMTADIIKEANHKK